jgi:hypothetical protein
MEAKDIQLEAVSDYLNKRSKGCKEVHWCNSYAYLKVEVEKTTTYSIKDVRIMKICQPEFLNSCFFFNVAVPLPWYGDAEEFEALLLELVEDWGGYDI